MVVIPEQFLYSPIKDCTLHPYFQKAPRDLMSQTGDCVQDEEDAKASVCVYAKVWGIQLMQNPLNLPGKPGPPGKRGREGGGEENSM